MKHCQVCGAELEDEARFCLNCGVAQAGESAPTEEAGQTTVLSWEEYAQMSAPVAAEPVPVAPAAPVATPQAGNTPVKYCEQCGSALDPSAQFCNRCGSQCPDANGRWRKPHPPYRPEQDNDAPRFRSGDAAEVRVGSAQMHGYVREPQVNAPMARGGNPYSGGGYTNAGGYAYPNGGGNSNSSSYGRVGMLNTNRSLLKFLLLGALTLGIYPLVIMSGISTDINTIASRHDGKKTMHYCLMFFLVSWLTFGIGSLVWCHRLCTRIGDELRRRGIYYDFGAGTYWGWGFFGSLIVVGPFVYVHKLLKAMNLLCEDYNIHG